MKNVIILFANLLICVFSMAQSPQAIPYQGVLRDSTGKILASQNISLRFTVRDSITSGVIVYQEIHSITTSSLGLFSTHIGEGTQVTGTLAGVNWGKHAKFLQVELDPLGGNNFADMGSSQFTSVPYSFNSDSAHVSGLTGLQGIGGNNKKAKISYQVPSGIDAGPAVGYAWGTRALNIIKYDDIGITLTSNQIRLPAGLYEVSANCVFGNANYQVAQEKIRIRNVTENSTLAISLNSSLSVAANPNISAYSATINSERFTLQSSTIIELQYFLTAANPVFGSSFILTGEDEVYAEIIFTKIQ